MAKGPPATSDARRLFQNSSAKSFFASHISGMAKTTKAERAQFARCTDYIDGN